MAGPIKQFTDAMAARWLELGYGDTPLVYDFNEAVRTRDLDAVAAGHGRIVYHAGGWPGPEAGAGELDANPLQAHEAARNVFTHWSLFTVHCHGYNPAFPDRSAPGAAVAQDDAAWLLMQGFLGVFAHVVGAKTWYRREGEPVWVRDPGERRFGELLRFPINVSFAVRQAPEHPKQHPLPVPKGTVETPNGPVPIVQGA